MPFRPVKADRSGRAGCGTTNLGTSHRSDLPILRCRPTGLGLVALILMSCSSKGTGATDDGSPEHTSDSSSPDLQSCQGESVTFQLEADDPSGWFFVDSGQDCIPPNWLSIWDVMGAEVPIGNPMLHCCNLADCATCSFQQVVCQNAWSTEPLPARRTWDVTMFPPSKCGPSQTACVMDRTCTVPGSYLARMCGSRIVNDQEQMTCVDVPFNLPTGSPIVGVLPP
jgi:hypothetical protein